MKDSFVLRTENKLSIDRMSDADAGRLLKAIMAHVVGEDIDESEEPLAVQILLPLIAAQIDRADEKYQEICAKRAEYGKKGGRPKKEEEKAYGFSENHKVSEDGEKKHKVFPKSIAKHNDPEPEPDSDPVPESPDGDKKKKNALTSVKEKGLLPDELDQDFVREAWRDYKTMRQRIRKPMTKKAEELAAKKLAELARGDPIRAVKILDQSVMNSWQGLFALKEPDSSANHSRDADAEMQEIWLLEYGKD